MSETERTHWTDRWTTGEYNARTEPSPLLVKWAASFPKGHALDIACGNGRNAISLAKLGFQVDAVDIASTALKLAKDNAKKQGVAVNWVEADLDTYEIPETSYVLISVCYYANRNLIPKIKDGLKPEGFLYYEHHYLSDVPVDGPQDRQWRMRSNELLHQFIDFRIRYWEEGLEDDRGRTLAMERLVAQKRPATYEPQLLK